MPEHVHAIPSVQLIAVLLGTLTAIPAQSKQAPNILFVLATDHATHAISAYGSKLNQTPNIDRLATTGMRFENCFCTNALGAPSRAVILTGKHSHRNRQITDVERFDGGQPTFPQLLQANGYQTALIGEWLLKSPPTGFDHWEVLTSRAAYYNPRLRTTAGEAKHRGHVTEVLDQRVLRWLQQEYGLDALGTNLLMTQCVRYEVGNVFDPDYTMVCKIAKDVLSSR